MDLSIIKTDLSVLERSDLPQVKNVNTTKTAISELDEDEKEELKLLYFIFKHDFSTYKQKRTALGIL